MGARQLEPWRGRNAADPDVLPCSRSESGHSGIRDCGAGAESLGLSFAKGTVLTPKGEVLVSWTRSSGWFTYQVTLPPRTKGVFSLEGVGVRSSMQVSVDRSAMKMYGRPIVLDAGTHRIAVSSGQQ